MTVVVMGRGAVTLPPLLLLLLLLLLLRIAEGCWAEADPDGWK
jgi:hypothetical protein